MKLNRFEVCLKIDKKGKTIWPGRLFNSDLFHNLIEMVEYFVFRIGQQNKKTTKPRATAPQQTEPEPQTTRAEPPLGHTPENRTNQAKPET